MKALPLAFLLLAGAVFADEKTHIDLLLRKESFAAARAAAEKALAAAPDDTDLAEQRAVAIRGLARDLQRARGYAIAIDFLERHLDHQVIAYAYGETCSWGGEEERGIAALRASSLPVAARIEPELQLLAGLRRLDEAAARAREVGWPKWAEWAEARAARRDRFTARGDRARTVAFVAGALLLAAVALLRRQTTGRSSARS